MTLTTTCPTCEGTGIVHLASYERCVGKTPASKCYGDCASCGGPSDCATCKGTGEVPDRDKCCVVCLEEDGKVVASVADNLCAECMDSVGSFALSVAS